jgi:hypothetical protein
MYVRHAGMPTGIGRTVVPMYEASASTSLVAGRSTSADHYGAGREPRQWHRQSASLGDLEYRIGPLQAQKRYQDILTAHSADGER